MHFDLAASSWIQYCKSRLEFRIRHATSPPEILRQLRMYLYLYMYDIYCTYTMSNSHVSSLEWAARIEPNVQRRHVCIYLTANNLWSRVSGIINNYLCWVISRCENWHQYREDETTYICMYSFSWSKLLRNWGCFTGETTTTVSCSSNWQLSTFYKDFFPSVAVLLPKKLTGWTSFGPKLQRRHSKPS